MLLSIIILICNTLLWAFLRAWYGGQFKETWLGNHRGIQTAVMIACAVPLFVFNWGDWKSILLGIGITLWAVFEYWSRGHGPGFDIGNDENPSQSTIDRYNDRWFNKICEYFFPCEWWYSRTYDACWMFLRYTLPTLPMAFISPLYIICGIVAPFIYDISWKTTNSWRKAEWMMGAVFGFVTMLVRLLYV